MTVHNPRLPAIQDEGAAQGFAHTLNFVGAGVTAIVVAGIATITISGGGGGSLTIGTFTATCPYPTVDQLFNIVDASVTGASKVLVLPAHYNDLDTNAPEDIDFSVDSVAAGSFNFRVRSKQPQPVGGPYKFFYFLG